MNAEEIRLKTGELVTLRMATTDDAANIAETTRRNLMESVFLMIHPEDFNPSKEQTADWIQFHQKKTNSLLLVAEVNDRIVAVQNFTGKQSKKTRHTGEYGVAILPEWRGKGLGQKMLSSLIKWASQNPEVEIMELQVFSGNTIARELYKKAGFEEVGHVKRAFKLDDGSYEDNVIMCLDVAD